MAPKNTTKADLAGMHQISGYIIGTELDYTVVVFFFL